MVIRGLKGVYALRLHPGNRRWHFVAKCWEDRERSVCNFQSMKSPVELNSLLPKFFCYITPGLLYHLIRSDSGRLANEAFTSNPIVSSKQWLNGLKITNCVTKRLLKLSPQNGSFSAPIKEMYVSFIFSFAERTQWWFNFPKFKGHFIYKKNIF